MQTLNWYYNRLKTMSPGEVVWRSRVTVRDYADQFLVDKRQRFRESATFLNGHGQNKMPGFRVCDTSAGDKFESNQDRWYKSLLTRAEKITEHKLDFFDLKEKYLGEPVKWNHDHKLDFDTPMVFSSSLDYRDIKEAGDCKFVWEPNRHHQLVVLGRAYRFSGDKKYAKAVAEQIESWLEQNPYGIGMNWRSGLELGIRLINWVWALDLIADSNAINKQLYLRILDSVSRHIWEIDRKYSRGSSVNNHLVGEAAGVFVAASYFNNLKNATKWSQKARDILIREIINQTYSDGGTKEQASGYHFFVLQFFTIAGITARAIGQNMPPLYWSRLEKMFEFLGLLSEGGDSLPMLGDCDDGYVLDLGQDPHDIKEWLAVGAAIYKRSDFGEWAGRFTETASWLLGESGHKRFNTIPEQKHKLVTSQAFRESGYYLLQDGERDSLERISVLFDCGSLGMKPLAAHGHADALSFTLRAFGKDILVDPGTYDYFSYPDWREYFRSTRAHNTMVVDDQNQSEILGLFLWGRKTNAKCLDWQPTENGGKVVAEHDGYSHLRDPVIHRRRLELNGAERILTIEDEIIANKEHKINIFFHIAEHCRGKRQSENNFLIDAEVGTVELQMDQSLNVKTFEGSENPIFGWVSRGYHQKQAGTTLVGQCTSKGEARFITRICIG